MLEQRDFGSLGKKVSVLGLGTVKFGRNKGVKYPGGDGFELPSLSKVEEILDLCLQNGINLLDTAPAYGVSEEVLGKTLRERREKFFLVSKVGEEFDDSGCSRYQFDEAYIRSSLERSLMRLKTDFIDCVLVHCNKNDLEILQNSAAFSVLDEFKSQGKILSFGASTYTNLGGKFAIDNSDCAMVTLNSEYKDDLPVVEYAKSKNKAILVKKGLASGHVANLGELSSNIKFVTGTAGVTSMIFGSLSPKNILSNIAAIA